MNKYNQFPKKGNTEGKIKKMDGWRKHVKDKGQYHLNK